MPKSRTSHQNGDQPTSFKGRQPPPSAKSTRAQYPNSVAPESRRPSTELNHSSLASQTLSRPLSSNHSVDERETHELTQPPGSTPLGVRDRYEVPPHAGIAATIALAEQQLRDTGVEEAFFPLVQLLLTLDNLPYNPYPGFVKRFKTRAERFHMFDLSDDQVVKLLSAGVEPTSGAHITKLIDSQDVWGLERVIRLSHPVKVGGYLEILAAVTPNGRRVQDASGYTVQAVSSLVGPSAFHGPIYPDPYIINVRIDFVITGPDTKRAISLYIENVIADILHSERDGGHVLLGVQVPALQAELNTWFEERWSCDQIHDKTEDFRLALSDAIQGNKYIYMDYLFCLDPVAHQYKKGQKQFGLNFIATTRDGVDDSRSYHTDFPLTTLHEGVFVNQTHAESYLATFTTKLDTINKKYQGSREVELPTRDGADSREQTTPKRFVPPWKARGARAPKVRVDGFKFGELRDHDPNAWQIVAPIKSMWQRRIAGHHPQGEIIEISHLALLLAAIDSEIASSALFVEIYRLQRSTAASLYNLMQMNRTIREVVLKYEGEAESSVVTHLFAQYRRGLIELLDHPMRERSANLTTCCRAAVQMLDELTSSADCTSKVALATKTVERLKAVNSYLYTVFLGLVEDALDHCRTLQTLIQDFRVAFPEEAARHTAGGQREDEDDPGLTPAVSYGREEDAILKHDDQVVNIESCMAADTAPTVISREAVLLRYMTDIRIEEVWSSFALDLVCGRQLPPNAFPRLVTAMRQSAMRMHLCYEAADRLLPRILHAGARVEDAPNFIYHIPGCDAHGLSSALSMLDTSAFHELTPLVDQFTQTKFRMRQGPYRIAICCAVSGFTPLYGRMDPFVRQVELHEHCYIRGPDGCWGEAIQVYSKIVYEHLLALYRSKQYFVVGVYMGEDQARWSVEDALNRKKGFALDFERHCGLHQPLFVKVMAQHDWRLIPVVKRFLFHFINDDERQFEELFPHNPASLYQSVFLDKDKAAFHFQYGGPPDRSNPNNSSNLRAACGYIDGEILQAKKQQDWLTVHRWLLLRNTIHQGSSLVSEAWRMLHSPAAQMEYVIALGRSLQDIVIYAVDLDLRRQRDDPASYHVTKRADDEEHLTRLEECLGSMVAAYRRKVALVCRSQCAMGPQCMGDVILDNLATVIERDRNTGKHFLLVNPKTTYVLEEVSQMLAAQRDALAYDVHAVSGGSLALLRSVEAEHLQRTAARPASVASLRLDDPHQYTHRPQARLPDRANDWGEL